MKIKKMKSKSKLPKEIKDSLAKQMKTLFKIKGKD
jgi:cation transport regulator ChaB